MSVLLLTLRSPVDPDATLWRVPMDDAELHYVEMNVTIGPIDPPYKLHTFTDDGQPRDTVHGERIERIREAIYEVDHEADVSAHVTTEAEAQRRADAETERDWLRAACEAFLDLWDRTTATRSVRILAVDALRAALEQGSRSDAAGEGGHHG